MKKLIKNHAGMGLMEILISIALLGGISLTVLQLSKMGSLSKRSSQSVNDIQKTMRVINSIFQNPFSCGINLAGKKTGVSEKLDRIQSEVGATLFETGKPVGSGTYKLESIVIGDYDASASQVPLAINFEQQGEALSAKSMSFKIFIKPEVVGGVIQNCLINLEDIGEDLVKKFCLETNPSGGGACDYQHLLEDAKEYFCTQKPWLSFDSSSKKCIPLDANKSCPNGITGYSSTGALICYNGTSGGSCTPSWTPALSSQCLGVSFTQTDGCGNSQPATGSKTTGSCVSCTPSWTPALSSQCPGTNVAQTDGCGNNRNRDGTKTTGCGGTTWNLFNPSTPPATYCDSSVGIPNPCTTPGATCTRLGGGWGMTDLYFICQ